jgi:hypothetical protein
MRVRAARAARVVAALLGSGATDANEAAVIVSILSACREGNGTAAAAAAQALSGRYDCVKAACISFAQLAGAAESSGPESSGTVATTGPDDGRDCKDWQLACDLARARIVQHDDGVEDQKTAIDALVQTVSRCVAAEGDRAKRRCVDASAGTRKRLLAEADAVEVWRDQRVLAIPPSVVSSVTEPADPGLLATTASLLITVFKTAMAHQCGNGAVPMTTVSFCFVAGWRHGPAAVFVHVQMADDFELACKDGAVDNGSPLQTFVDMFRVFATTAACYPGLSREDFGKLGAEMHAAATSVARHVTTRAHRASYDLERAQVLAVGDVFAVGAAGTAWTRVPVARPQGRQGAIDGWARNAWETFSVDRPSGRLALCSAARGKIVVVGVAGARQHTVSTTLDCLRVPLCVAFASDDVLVAGGHEGLAAVDMNSGLEKLLACDSIVSVDANAEHVVFITTTGSLREGDTVWLNVLPTGSAFQRATTSRFRVKDNVRGDATVAIHPTEPLAVITMVGVPEVVVRAVDGDAVLARWAGGAVGRAPVCNFPVPSGHPAFYPDGSVVWAAIGAGTLTDTFVRWDPSTGETRYLTAPRPQEILRTGPATVLGVRCRGANVYVLYSSSSDVFILSPLPPERGPTA